MRAPALVLAVRRSALCAHARARPRAEIGEEGPDGKLSFPELDERRGRGGAGAQRGQDDDDDGDDRGWSASGARQKGKRRAGEMEEQAPRGEKSQRLPEGKFKVRWPGGALLRSCLSSAACLPTCLPAFCQARAKKPAPDQHAYVPLHGQLLNKRAVRTSGRSCRQPGCQALTARLCCVRRAEPKDGARVRERDLCRQEGLQGWPQGGQEDARPQQGTRHQAMSGARAWGWVRIQSVRVIKSDTDVGSCLPLFASIDANAPQNTRIDMDALSLKRWLSVRELLEVPCRSVPTAPLARVHHERGPVQLVLQPQPQVVQQLRHHLHAQRARARAVMPGTVQTRRRRRAWNSNVLGALQRGHAGTGPACCPVEWTHSGAASGSRQ